MRIIGTKILLSTPKTAQLIFSKLREALLHFRRGLRCTRRDQAVHYSYLKELLNCDVDLDTFGFNAVTSKTLTFFYDHAV